MLKSFGTHIQKTAMFLIAVFGLCLTLQMTYFGVLFIPYDLNEANFGEAKNNILRDISIKCENWTYAIGYRLTCRKLIADAYFRYHYSQVSDSKAKDTIDSVLQISPLEPAYYVQRTRIGLLAQDDLESLVDSLRMSYLSGRSARYVMSDRFILALALWDNLEPSDKAIAINDLTRNLTEKKAELYALLLNSPNSTIDEVLELTQFSLPEFHRRLQTDIENKKNAN